jgi:hypothetical protein
MRPVMNALHTESAQFPSVITAVKLAAALAIHEFERLSITYCFGVDVTWLVEARQLVASHSDQIAAHPDHTVLWDQSSSGL